jgi:ribosomal protein L12E/L44/L45/RPP1/RPP2
LNSFEPGAASKEFRETNFVLRWRMFMAKVGTDQDFDEILSRIGPDGATAINGSDEELEEEDDDAAALEEDDEMDEEEDVEDEAGV